MAATATEHAPLRVFRLWTLLLFRLIPARFAIAIAGAILFIVVEAPAGFPLHLLGCLLLGFFVLPIILGVLESRRRRLERQAQPAQKQAEAALEQRETADPPRWQQVQKFERRSPSRCIKFPSCRHNRPAGRTMDSLRSRLR